jgi:hypothetical protein
MTEPTGRVFVLQGRRYAGSLDLADEVIAEIDGGSDGFARVRVVGDRDGDGVVDVFFGQTGWDAGDTAGGADSAALGDTGGGSGLAPAGRAFVADASLVDAAIADLAWRTAPGRPGDAFGWDVAMRDFDADGQDDAVVSAIGHDGYAGALYFFAGHPDTAGPAGAVAEVIGSTAEGEFGFAMAAVDDLDGDGVDDLLVSELFGGSSREGLFWVLSGSAAWRGAGDAESAALLAWSGEETEAYTGNSLAAGDVDGDGVAEFAVGAEVFTDGTGTTYGKVYVIR